MSNRLSTDQLWKEAFDFLRANLKDGERVMAPDEFIRMLPNGSPYSQSHAEAIDQFSWIVFHKGRLNQVNPRFLIDASVSLTPVLANAVFVIFSKSADLLQIYPSRLHLESFLTRVLKLTETEDKALLTKQLQLSSSPFQDQFWSDALDFLKSQAQPDQKFLLPDEFCDLFTNAHSYPQSFTEPPDYFDWILLHKSRLHDASLKFLIAACRTQIPVFANEVFVLFSPIEVAPRVGCVSEHLRSFVARIWFLRTKDAIERLLENQAGLLGQSAGKKRRKSLVLIERPRQPKSWIPDFHAPVFIPVTWAATSPKYPFANLGDALSPIMVSALSGFPTEHRNFDSWKRKLACVGTIAHGFRNGTVHFWGTGIDPLKNPIDPSLGYYTRPPSTRFQIHALRGLLTAQTFRNQGIEVPDVYGDPIWFLPSIIPPAETKQYDLGVVVHLSELTALTDTAGLKPNLQRYLIPEDLTATIQIITTLTQPTFAALEERVKQITACKRIVSTSLHGLVIAETYGIPCVGLRNRGRGAAMARLDDESERVDARIRDFYSGVGLEKLFIYGQRRARQTDWEDLIQAIDTHWQPLEWFPEPFLDSFPLPLAFNPLAGELYKNRSLLEQIQL